MSFLWGAPAASEQAHVLNPTTTDLELPWPFLHGNGQSKKCVYGQRYAVVAIDKINASQSRSDRPTKRPCLGVEDVPVDTSSPRMHYPQHTGVTVQPFVTSKPAPSTRTRSQEPPKRLTRISMPPPSRFHRLLLLLYPRPPICLVMLLVNQCPRAPNLLLSSCRRTGSVFQNHSQSRDSRPFPHHHQLALLQIARKVV
jgi:hypothetical protein